MAVFFLVFELISAASSAIVVLSYYNQAKQECSNISSSDDDDGDGDVSVGSYDKTLKSMAYAVAQAMHKAYGYKPELVFAQLGHETGFKAGYTNATKNFNLAGIKYTASMSDYAKPGESVGDGTGGIYAKFKSLDAFATVYYKQYLKPDFGKTKPKTVQEWAHLLKVHKYYTDSEENYVNGMNSFLDEYKKYDAAHKNDSKKDSSSSSKKKTSTAKKKKTAAIVHNQKKTLSDLIVDVDKPEEAGDMNNLVKKENEKSTISETAKEDAKSTSKASSASSASSSSRASSKTSSKKDDSKSSSSKKDDSTDSSSDESNSESSLGITEDSCKAIGFETEDDDNDSSGDWAYPFKGMTYKSAKANMLPAQSFGPGTAGGRPNGYHDGEDFGTHPYGGKAIRAIHDGKVIDVSVDPSDISGHVVTKSSDGWYIVYQEFYHTEGSSAVKVKKGQTVHAGDTIGILSESYGADHVHIGITKKVWSVAKGDSFSSAGGWKDPLELIKKGIASGGSLGSLNLTGNDKQRAKAMIKAMKKMDPKATDEGIAAILGNWTFESGNSYLKPDAVNPGSGAKGLGQWLGNRAAGLDAYAKKKGKSWKDPAVQLEFAYKGEDDSEIFKKILRSKGSAYDLGYKFSQQWERGGYDEGHAKSARTFYNSFFK